MSCVRSSAESLYEYLCKTHFHQHRPECPPQRDLKFTKMTSETVNFIILAAPPLNFGDWGHDKKMVGMTKNWRKLIIKLEDLLPHAGNLE